jgi:hypothetical protein
VSRNVGCSVLTALHPGATVFDLFSAVLSWIILSLVIGIPAGIPGTIVRIICIATVRVVVSDGGIVTIVVVVTPESVVAPAVATVVARNVWLEGPRHGRLCGGELGLR